MSLTLTREALSNQIADDLATRNTNAGLIEGAVNAKAEAFDVTNALALKAPKIAPTFDASTGPVTINNTGEDNSLEAPNFAVAKNGAITSPTVTALEARVDNILNGQDLDPNKDVEVLDARTSAITGEVFDVIGDRMAATEEKFQSTTDKESAPLGDELATSAGWTLGTGWSGDFATGFSHTPGSVEPLTFTMDETGTKQYQVTFTPSADLISGELSVIIGNSAYFDLYGQEIPVSVGIQSISDGNLIFTPASAFNKTITDISIKEITGTFEPTLKIKDSENTDSLEIRNTKYAWYNVFLGNGAGEQNTTGTQNVALGAFALNKNTSGFWNVAIGKQALISNTVGSRNIAIGYTALSKNISGQRNIAIGSFALLVNTTGDKNISIGSDSLFANTTGSFNLAFGFGAMAANISGKSNVAIGANSLGNNHTGNYNVAIGEQALVLATESYNVGIGWHALGNNTSGINNTVIGFGSGGYLGSGAIGNNTVIGHYAGMKLSTGANNNVLIGYRAGNDITTGASNILIGYDIDTPLATTSDHLNIGNLIYGNISTKKLGINVTEPTSRLHLPAGTATAGTSSLKLDLGVLLTTPEAGAIEYDGTNLYFTDSTGTRHTLSVVA